MNWDYFASLSQNEARSELEAFIANGSSTNVKLLRAANLDHIGNSFSTTNARALLTWAAPFATSVAVSPPNDLPDWLRNVHEQHYGFSELNAHTKILTLRCAYFLGQSFVAEFPSLNWTTGNNETALANMPVVAGFLHDMELPPILVVENLFSRAIDDSSSISDIDTTVDKWLELVSN
jgi:hypothetical protein